MSQGKTATSAEVRAVFDGAIAGTTDPDRVAHLELLREWFTNPAFRAAASDLVWETLQAREGARVSSAP